MEKLLDKILGFGSFASCVITVCYFFMVVRVLWWIHKIKKIKQTRRLLAMITYLFASSTSWCWRFKVCVMPPPSVRACKGLGLHCDGLGQLCVIELEWFTLVLSAQDSWVRVTGQGVNSKLIPLLLASPESSWNVAPIFFFFFLVFVNQFFSLQFGTKFLETSSTRKQARGLTGEPVAPVSLIGMFFRGEEEILVIAKKTPSEPIWRRQSTDHKGLEFCICTEVENLICLLRIFKPFRGHTHSNVPYLFLRPQTLHQLCSQGAERHGLMAQLTEGICAK